MRNSFLTITVTLALVVAHASWTRAPYRESQQPLTLAERLRTPVQSYTLKAGNFPQALLKIGSQFKIPMGIAWVRMPSALTKVDLSWKHTTVQGIIQAIVRTQRGYDVEIGESIVHIAPVNLVPDKEDFLSLRVTNFSVRNEVAEIASKQLHALVGPSIARPKRILAGGILGTQLTEAHDPNISIDLKNVSCEGALDAISRISPFKIWLVTFAPDNSLTPTGFRRTVWAARGEAFPDADQPVWELLKWGRAPY
jgi:hypothetical protein